MGRSRKTKKAIDALAHTLHKHKIDVVIGAEAMLVLAIAGLMAKGRDKAEYMAWINKAWGVSEDLIKIRRRRGLKVISRETPEDTQS